MRYVRFRSGPWPPLGAVGRVVQSAIGVLVPLANPDFEGRYETVDYWWLEIDEGGQVQREVAFTLDGEPVAVGPLGPNYGIFTDAEGAPSPIDGEVERGAFERAWTTVKVRFPQYEERE